MRYFIDPNTGIITRESDPFSSYERYRDHALLPRQIEANKQEVPKKLTEFQKSPNVAIEKKAEADLILLKEALKKHHEDRCREASDDCIKALKQYPDDYVLCDRVEFELYKNVVMTSCCNQLLNAKNIENQPECILCRINNPEFIRCLDLQKIVDEHESDLKKLCLRLENEIIAPEEIGKLRKEFEARDAARQLDFKIKTEAHQILRKMRIPPKEFAYDNPLLTQCGHYVNGDVAKPDCKCDKKVSLFLKDPNEKELSGLCIKREKLLKDFKEEKLTQISFIALAKKQMKEEESILNPIKNKKRYDVLFVRDRIAELKLDNTNQEHLSYWDKKTYRWCGHGGVAVIHYDPVQNKNVEYRIPNGIFKAMQEVHIMRRDAINADTFIARIKSAMSAHRLVSPLRNRFHHFIFGRLLQASETQKAYGENLETLRLG